MIVSDTSCIDREISTPNRFGGHVKAYAKGRRRHGVRCYNRPFAAKIVYVLGGLDF
jgi:hypothetical protein